MLLYNGVIKDPSILDSPRTLLDSMAMTSSSTSSLFPTQQQPQQQLLGNVIEPTTTSANLAATNAPNGSDHFPSGSIGQFLAVISVIVVLSVLSCFLGRICAGRARKVAEADPLEMIKSGGVLGWLRRKWRRCLAGDVESGAKVADCAGKETPKVSDQTHPNSPPV